MFVKSDQTDHFSFPALKVPLWLARRKELSQGAKLAWAVIAHHLLRQSTLGDEQIRYEVPSQAQMAKSIGVTDRQFRDYVKELISYGLLTVEKTAWGKPNSYTLKKNTWIPRSSPSPL
jgi:hypothetical protein